MLILNVWMISQGDYSPAWDYLIQRAGFNDCGMETNAYFLNPEKLTQDDLWHLERTKWRQVEAEILDFDVMWDYDFDGNGFVDGFEYENSEAHLFESDSLDSHDISERYWFNTVDHIPYQASTAQFLTVKKSVVKEEAT